MILGEDKFEIGNGDTICIPPGTAHKVENFSGVELVILCCCVRLILMKILIFWKTSSLKQYFL